MVPAGGDAYMRVQVVRDGLARNHLDLHTGQVSALAGRAAALGAVRVFEDSGRVVFRSPAGLPFCVVPWAGEAVRPGPAGASLVDQMCLDIPVAGFDAEADFWAALTGWERRPGSLAEFDFLIRPDGMPLRLLLQRTRGSAVQYALGSGVRRRGRRGGAARAVGGVGGAAGAG